MNSQARSSPRNQKSGGRRSVAAGSLRKLAPAPSTIELSPIANPDVQPLSSSERTEFKRCEAIIAKGWNTFVEVGKALTLIRDQRLYRADYKTFEAYCRLKWQFGRAYAYRLISAAEVVAYLSTIGDTALPENEAQVRPLIGLTPEQIKKVWIEAISDDGQKPITARAIREKASHYRCQSGPKMTTLARRKAKAHIDANEVQELLDTVTQLEEAIRRGSLTETILTLLSRLKAPLEELSNVFEIQGPKQKR